MCYFNSAMERRSSRRYPRARRNFIQRMSSQGTCAFASWRTRRWSRWSRHRSFYSTWTSIRPLFVRPRRFWNERRSDSSRSRLSASPRRAWNSWSAEYQMAFKNKRFCGRERKSDSTTWLQTLRTKRNECQEHSVGAGAFCSIPASHFCYFGAIYWDKSRAWRNCYFSQGELIQRKRKIW